MDEKPEAWLYRRYAHALDGLRLMAENGYRVNARDMMASHGWRKIMFFVVASSSDGQKLRGIHFKEVKVMDYGVPLDVQEMAYAQVL